MLGTLGAIWGVAGVMLLVGSAVYRLTPVALEALRSPLDAVQWLVLVAFGGFMVFQEGYQGFQRRFAPRVVARAVYLRRHPRGLHSLLAPLFCMAFFHATARRRRISIGVTLAIVIAVLVVRQLSQPWRGIIDFGVVAGLVWGLGALAVFAGLALAGRPVTHRPDVPEPDPT